MDETSFDRTHVPQDLAEKVRNWRNFSVCERFSLTNELSVAAWAEVGFVYDPSKPMDKTIRRVSTQD